MMYKMKPLYNFLLLISLLYGCITPAQAQEISVSDELSLRSYISYEIIGQVDNRLLVYRDKGVVKEIDVFDTDMQHKLNAELFFEKKKTAVINAIAVDTVFQLLYGFSDRDNFYLRMRRFNKRVEMVDSSAVLTILKSDIKREFKTILSEDKSKVLIYTVAPEDKLYCIVYDNHLNKLLWSAKLINPEHEPSPADAIVLTDDGVVVIVPSNKSNKKEDDNLEIFSVGRDLLPTRNIITSSSEFYRKNLFLDYDNNNNSVIVAGTFTEKRGREVRGYYLLNEKIENLANAEVNLAYFSPELKSDFIEDRKQKKNVFDDLKIREIIKRNDGGLVVFAEVYREFTRRHGYSDSFSHSGYGGSARGWLDYYNEDILVSNFTPNYEEDWFKILYKKQFSQDDDAVFSSFFLMKNPSRLRLIFNDEIKRSNTVSEYLLDPTGEMARNSILSTAYQDMRLRFKDAVQISANSLLIPSENSYNFNLVKITY